MPQVIPVVSAIAASVSALAAMPIIGAALKIGLSLGLSFLASALLPGARRPNQPTPEDVQQSTRQAIAPRFKHYGRVKTSGPWTFAESKNGNFHKVIALAHGEIDAIEEYWIDDTQVTVDVNGIVTTGEPFSTLGTERPRILTELGTTTQTAFTNLVSEFAEWTTDHRGRGIALLYSTQFAVSNDLYLKTYPNGINTNYRCVIRGAKVENPTTSTVGWSDNPAAIIRDYLTNADGMRLPSSIIDTTQALAAWQTAQADADALYDLKAGGTEKRYRTWGTYKFDERPADVLSRMLKSCDGKFKLTSDGGLTLRVGKWTAPTVTIGESAIVGFTVKQGRDVLTTANTIKATFLSPEQGYQTAEADPWIDATDVSERGEIANEVAFAMSPSHAQTRRLMKIESYRANPDWVGTFVCGIEGLAAFNEDFITINYPPLGINQTFELLDFQFNFGESNILESVTLQVASFPEEAYSWDEDLEEGTAPSSTETTVSDTIPIPQNLDVDIITKTLSGVPAAVAVVSFDAPPPSLQVAPEFKLSTDSTWLSLAVVSNGTTAETPALSDGATYNFRARHISATGRFSAYTDIINVEVFADPAAPSPVVGSSFAPSENDVSIAWTMPNSANVAKALIRRNTTNDEGTASLIATVFGGPNTSLSYLDAGLASGTYYYWIRAANASSIESTASPSGAIGVDL